MKSSNFRNIKIAIIGCGNIANYHIEALKEFNLTALHCASSPNSKKIIKFSNKYEIKNVWKNPIELAKS